MIMSFLLLVAAANMCLAWHNVHCKEPNKRFKRLDYILAYLLIIGGVSGLIQALNELLKFNF